MPQNTWWIWAIMAAVFIAGEIVTTGFFLLCFGIGAAAAALLSWLGIGLVGQLGGFIVVSLIAFIASRRFADRVSKPQPPGIGADRFIGRRGVVLETINNHDNTGRVRFEKEEWRADSERDEDIIPVGARVIVTRLSGTHVVVEPVKGDV